jgi:hypothetical protein
VRITALKNLKKKKVEKVQPRLFGKLINNSWEAVDVRASERKESKI